MITAYLPAAKAMLRVEIEPGGAIPQTAVWLDLYCPTADERRAAEHLMAAEIPTREEMAQIETSERLYEEPGALIMTAVMPMAARESDPRLSTLTFVLNARRLVTVRYGEPLSIVACAKRAQNDASIPHTGPGVMFMLLDSIVDRAADVIEAAVADFDALSHRVFETGVSSRKSADFKDAIKTQGRLGLKVSRMHDCCSSLERLLLFLSFHARKANLSNDQLAACKSLGRDIHSIKEHADALDNKLSFLLDATIGLVNLEQNQIIKIFSVLAVIFLPPTLIASIYGMNFSDMPELHWSLGYPFSIGIMVLSVLLTFLYFRWQKLL